MPRNISFALTTPQFKARTKTVTRRLGWENVKAGDVLCAVEKGQGMKKGEKVKRLGMIRVKSVRREPLAAITADDCRREGFPEKSPQEFVEMFCMSNGYAPSKPVTRIEFEYLEHAP